jgi:hypothetical protein
MWIESRFTHQFPRKNIFCNKVDGDGWSNAPDLIIVSQSFSDFSIFSYGYVDAERGTRMPERPHLAGWNSKRMQFFRFSLALLLPQRIELD